MKNKTYLPNERTNYNPTDEECMNTTVSGNPQQIPNPAKHRIVVNNIANAEFDYIEKLTQDNKE